MLTVLSSDAIMPIASVHLVLIGLVIVWKALRKKVDREVKTTIAAPTFA